MLLLHTSLKKMLYEFFDKITTSIMEGKPYYIKSKGEINYGQKLQRSNL